MKKLNLLFLFVFAALTTNAYRIFVKDSMPVIGKALYNFFDSSRIIGFSPLGTVYPLPQDRMPVLRPDTNVISNMPVRKMAHPQIFLPAPATKQNIIADPFFQYKKVSLTKSGLNDSIKVETPTRRQGIKIH